MTKLSYAWVRNTPLFKSVSTGLTFDEKHKLAVDLMVAKLERPFSVDFDHYEQSLFVSMLTTLTPQGMDYWIEWDRRIQQCKTTTAQ